MQNVRLDTLRAVAALTIIVVVGAAGPLVRGISAAPLVRSHLLGVKQERTAGVMGPISIYTSIDTDACLGGEVALSATVQDVLGAGIQGATVAGTLQYGSIARSFAFPETDDAGNTSTTVDTTRPAGIRDVYFTVDATAGSNTAEAQMSC